MKVLLYILDCSTGRPSGLQEDECCLISEWRFNPLESTVALGYQLLLPAGQELGESLDVRLNRDLTDH